MNTIPKVHEIEQARGVTWAELAGLEPRLNELLWKARAAGAACRAHQDVPRVLGPICNAMCDLIGFRPSTGITPSLDRPGPTWWPTGSSTRPFPRAAPAPSTQLGCRGGGGPAAARARAGGREVTGAAAQSRGRKGIRPVRGGGARRRGKRHVGPVPFRSVLPAVPGSPGSVGPPRRLVLPRGQKATALGAAPTGREGGQGLQPQNCCTRQRQPAGVAS
jgi:hypothetical protein